MADRAQARKGRACVIVLNFNGSDDTVRCVQGFLPQLRGEDEVLVIDNASRPEEREAVARFMAETRDARLRFLPLPANLGFAGGMMRGFEETNAPLLILLNNDTQVEPGWLEALLAPFQDRHVASAFAALRHGPSLRAPGATGLNVFGQTYAEASEHPAQTRVVGGYCFAVRRDAALDVGGLFPPEYFIYFEEVDLSWRLWARGWRVALAPGSVLVHAGETTLRRDPRSPVAMRLLRSRVRNKYLTFWRNSTRFEFLLLAPFLLGLDALRILGLVGRGKSYIARARAQGILEFLRRRGAFPRTGARARGFLTVDFRRHRL